MTEHEYERTYIASMIWMGNFPHNFMCFNFRSLAGGAVTRSCGILGR